MRANRNPKPGYRNLNVHEYQEAYLVCQHQWRRAARDCGPHGSIDDVVENCLPSEHDQLDVRLALAPRLAAQPTPMQTPAPMQPWSAGIPQLQQPPTLALEDAAQPPTKRRRLNRRERALRQAASGAPPAAAAGNGKGQHGTTSDIKAKGAGKAKGKLTDAEMDRRAGKGQWCKHFQETGSCRFGDKCWFRHT